MDAGFGDMVMFGSDQMIWPQAILLAIDAIEAAEFLMDDQKRDIMYFNTVHFLRIKT
jgi:hypothetical protein